MLMGGASEGLMLPHIYLTARVELQEVEIVADGQRLYAPMIGAPALKYWHARAMAVKYLKLGGTRIHMQHFEEGMYITRRIAKRIAEEARQKVLQSAQGEKGQSGKEGEKAEQNSEVLSYERVLVEDCAICDVHGFTLAIQGHPRVLRGSCVKFSPAVPYIDEMERAKKLSVTRNIVITHNMVPSTPREMVVIMRDSARYAWSSLANLADVGTSQYLKRANSRAWVGARLIDVDEIVRRVKSMILAYDALLTGGLGALASRDLTPLRPVEAVSIVAKRPIPPLHPPYYVRVIEFSLARYKEYVKAAYTFGASIEGAEPCGSIHDLLENSASEAEEAVRELWRNLEGVG